MTDRRTSLEKGFSLIEALVAVAVFAVIMIAAMTLYDRSNKMFKQSTESAEMQQNTRIAFDKMVSELRMSGFDYKRTGKDPGAVASPWVAVRTYGVGALVTPTTANGHYYRAIVAGTSKVVEIDKAWIGQVQVNQDYRGDFLVHRNLRRQVRNGR